MTKKNEKDYFDDLNDVQSILANAVTRVALKRLVTDSVVAKTPEELNELIDKENDIKSMNLMLSEYKKQKIQDEKNAKGFYENKPSTLIENILTNRIKNLRKKKEKDIEILFKNAFIKSQK